jgi:hypothetical protein
LLAIQTGGPLPNVAKRRAEGQAADAPAALNHLLFRYPGGLLRTRKSWCYRTLESLSRYLLAGHKTW